MIRSMITTKDNPFDPFVQFDDWLAFDELKGYDTCSYLDRVSFSSDDLSDFEIEMENERAIDEIIAYNPLGIYEKVQKEF